MDPDIAEAHGVSVVLHLQKSFVIVFYIFASRVRSCPASAAVKLYVVLNDNAIVDDGEFGASGDFAFFVKDRAMEGDVIGLPLAGFATGIHHGWEVAVEAGGLAIGIIQALKQGVHWPPVELAGKEAGYDDFAALAPDGLEAAVSGQLIHDMKRIAQEWDSERRLA